MSPNRILFVDNNDRFRSVRAKFLRDDYEVQEARSVQEAVQYLHDGRVHLAIVDMRLEDDTDNKDFSGLLLAKDPAFRTVPKIILTGFPSFETARTALVSKPEGLPLAIDFLDKKEGPEALVQAVEHAFAQHVRISWALKITTNERHPVTFHQLAALIEPGLEGERFLNRAGELEDVLRRLFYTKDQIRLNRVLWQRTGRAALEVLALQEGIAPASFVVVCGQSIDMLKERQRYDTYAPKTMGFANTVLNAQTETVHFSAHAYVLAGDGAVDNLQTLETLYYTASEKTFDAALENLIGHTLTGWGQGQPLRDRQHTLDVLYRQRLGWAAEITPREALTTRIQALVHRLPTLELSIEPGTAKIAVCLYGRTFSYPDPISSLFQPFDNGQSVLLIHSPGILTGDNVLIDTSIRTWVTDMANAGLAPLLWHYVTLEALIRFDWVAGHDLGDFHSLEQCLIHHPFSRPDLRDIEPALRKTVRVIQALRRLATPAIEHDASAYHLGLLFQAAHRLLAFDPEAPLSPGEWKRLGHILLAAVMLAGKIEDADRRKTGAMLPEQQGLRIDHANRAVWVDGQAVDVTGQSYDLLLYLYDNTGRLCTRRELVEEVFQEPYAQTDTSQIRRLNTAMSRLRDKIEANSKHPKYVLTAPAGGYRLIQTVQEP